MVSVIYKISFVDNPKVYIGKSIEPEKRWNKHKRNAKNGLDSKLYRAMRKYGIENTKFEVISNCLKEEYANEAEISLIAQYDSFKNGYNSTLGGDGMSAGLLVKEKNPMWGKKLPEKTIKFLQETSPHSKKCICEGFIFDSVSSAARKYNMLVATVRYRLNSSNFKDWNYI